jgi:amino acid transporter
VLFVSYWQTITAYPSNGGSYVVARENIGTNAGLLAAAALMVDYTLNVAVGIAAGVGALTSALPALQPHTLLLCLLILAALTLVNLRGTRETGLALAVPTYLFIATLGGLIVWGVLAGLGGSLPHPVVAPPPLPAASRPVTLWLLLRTFASGCTAMTGVEAVSNGVSAFREPATRHAHATLSAMVAVLTLLLLGIAWLVQGYGIAAMDQTQPGYQSVLSQLTEALVGRGWFYYVTIAGVLAVLCLSANTSFVGFPRLCHLVARDGFLPSAFALPGRRLVYSVGVLFLAAGAGLLLAAFGGITDRLIPLFAVGAFLSFTLSQAGMAMHWRRTPAARWAQVKLIVNGGGAVATGVALAVILVAKFVEGAWLTVLVIPLALLLLRLVRRYYANIERHLLRGADARLNLRAVRPPVVLVPLERWDRAARKAVGLALRLSDSVTALHLTELAGPEAEEHTARLQHNWQQAVAAPAQAAGLPAPQLRIESSPYRSLRAPLLRMVAEMRAGCGGRMIMVVLPQLVEASWWETLLHTHRERRVRAALLRHGGPDVTVLSVPWQLGRAAPQTVIAEEEPAPAR